MQQHTFIPEQAVLLYSCCLLLLLLLCTPSAAHEKGKRLQTLAFGSCYDPRVHSPLWDALVDSQPDVFAWLGDSVYADRYEGGVSQHIGLHAHQQLYRTLNNTAGYKRLRNTSTIVGTADDHGA